MLELVQLTWVFSRSFLMRCASFSMLDDQVSWTSSWSESINTTYYSARSRWTKQHVRMIKGIQEWTQLIEWNLKIKVIPVLILIEISPSVHETWYLKHWCSCYFPLIQQSFSKVKMSCAFLWESSSTMYLW